MSKDAGGGCGPEAALADTQNPHWSMSVLRSWVVDRSPLQYSYGPSLALVRGALGTNRPADLCEAVRGAGRIVLKPLALQTAPSG